MPNDSKFGLVIGVALVVASAVLFYQKAPDAPAPVQSEMDDPKNRAATPAMLPPPSSLPRPEAREYSEAGSKERDR